VAAEQTAFGVVDAVDKCTAFVKLSIQLVGLGQDIIGVIPV
jgi:hypothetical protein